MLAVALWSKYPQGYVTGKIQPKLQARGIIVTKFLTERMKDTDLSNVDAILCMHEFASHHEYERLCDVAKASNKQVIAFSRKESFWGRDLQPLTALKDEKMAAPKAISDAKVDSFCRKYMELKQKGYSYDQMIPTLASFWENGKLDNAGQLRQYVRHMLQKNRAPNFFVKFMEKHEQERREQEILKEQVVEEMQTAPPSNLNSSLPPLPPLSKTNGVLHPPASFGSSDLEVELQLYKEEVSKLEATNRDLKSTNDTHTRRIQILEGEVARLVKVSKSSDSKFMKILSNIFEAVDLEIMDRSDAFSKIVDLYKKNL